MGKECEKRQRASWDEYFMDITRLVARRSTCMRRQVGAVGHDDHACVLAVADTHTTAVMDADPTGTGGGVHERVEHGPVGDRVRTILHRFGLAIGACDRTRVEVVAADDDRRLQLAVGDVEVADPLRLAASPQAVRPPVPGSAPRRPQAVDSRNAPLEALACRA